MAIESDLPEPLSAGQRKTLPRSLIGRLTATEPGTRRFNYWAHAIEGSLFIGAMAFVNANTLLPTIIESLQGPSWLISLMPVMMQVGFLLPPIFTAHWIERLHRYKPMLLATGVAQRAPYLLAAVGLFFLADRVPPAMLALLVALAPLLSGVAGGISMTGWQQLVANTVPENRRNSLLALRFLLGSVMGITCGWTISAVLKSYPGATGYGILHLYAFAALMASYVVFATIREPRMVTSHVHVSQGLMASLSAMPRLLRADPQFLLYLLWRFFRNGIFIVAPFLAIHAQWVLGKPESYVGQLSVMQMLGAIVGNVMAAYLGDRIGSKIVIVIGTLVMLALTAWSTVAQSSLEFQLIFLLHGIGFFSTEVGQMALLLDAAPKARRSSFLAVAQLVTLPGMLLAAWGGAAVWNGNRQFTVLCIVALVCLALATAAILPVRDPRRKTKT